MGFEHLLRFELAGGMMYMCALDNKEFETREGLQYLYTQTGDENDPNVVRYWDWVVCSEGCADKVREQPYLKVIEDRPF